MCLMMRSLVPAKNSGVYEGMPVEFSGDRMRSPLKETLTISGYTTKPLLIQINNYLNAKSSVLITCSYGAIVPCEGWQPDTNAPVNLKKC